MADDLVWILLSVHRPQDGQRMHARVKYGLTQKVTFYTQPTPRWEDGSSVYDFLYFSEWAPLASTDQRTEKPGG
jgi:hypothetical protein